MLWCIPAAIPRRAGRIGRTAMPDARFDHGDRGEEQGIPAAIPRRAGRIGSHSTALGYPWILITYGKNYQPTLWPQIMWKYGRLFCCLKTNRRFSCILKSKRRVLMFRTWSLWYSAGRTAIRFLRTRALCADAVTVCTRQKESAHWKSVVVWMRESARIPAHSIRWCDNAFRKPGTMCFAIVCT